MNETTNFQAEVEHNIKGLSEDTDLQGFSRVWLREVGRHKYAYNFSWMGRPIIQLPQDIIAMQEIIWRIQPDAIVETGVAHGGSLIFYSSMLHLTGHPDAFVVGVDIDIRQHNRQEIESHPMSSRIRLVEGSSVLSETVEMVRALVQDRKRILLVLDSNHTHEHVLEELRLYTSLVTKGSYCIVFDTAIEDMPDDLIIDRPWRRGNSPKSAVQSFLSETDRFEVDKSIDAKLLISVSPGGYLKCVR